MNSNSPKIFFITGRGRSGTWLLQSLLDSHSKICVAPEALFIKNLHPSYKGINKWTKDTIQQFVDDLFLDAKIPLWWNLEKEETLSYLNKHSRADYKFAEYCKLVYSLFASKKGKDENVLLGDKNPEYTLFQKDMLQIFPNSKIIHMVRDPRDNIPSYQKVSFDLNNPGALAYRWNYYNKAFLDAKKSYPNNILLIKYEDLLQQPEQTLKSICDFIDVPFNDSILKSHSKEGKSVFSWNEKIQSPIDASNAFKWETLENNNTQNHYISKICNKLINYFSYKNYKHNNPPLKFNFYLGVLQGIFISFLERCFYILPYKLKMRILHIYRVKAKVIDK